MNIIDQRILIPFSPERIWHILNDVTLNPNWQADCKAVSILTTMRSGQGMRWRCTTRGGSETVMEVSAWYDRLGYEYRVVDGGAYRENKGLIRLQDVPEGTIVQWTFSYEPSGMLAGLRNTLTLRRSIEGEMEDSLRALYRYVSKTAVDKEHHAKSLMQDAPDVEARAQYKPRHPSVLESKPVSLSDNDAPQPLLMSEPPILEDDTRPNAAAVVTDVREPDFLTSAPTTETRVASDTDAIFRPPAEPTQVSTFMPVPSESLAETPISTPSPVIETDETSFDLPTLETSTDMDTSKLSVFELFGLPKPSETQNIQAVTAATTAPVEAPSTIGMHAVDVSNRSFPSRMGLRIRLRRRRTLLRRP